jgi:transcriptional regulator with XRE-family HTH domain
MGDAACPSPAGLGQASPLLFRMLAGAALHRLRVDQGLSYEDTAAAIGEPPGLVSMMENGETTIRMRDVVDLADLYGVRDIGHRATLVTLAWHGNRGEWWQEYLDVIPGWFERYLGLEQAAPSSAATTQLIRARIRGPRAGHAGRRPGLLQAPGYIRAVLALNHGTLTRRDISRRAELRARRQDVLHRSQPARLWAIIDEAALRRPAGGRAVMRAQLRHLRDAWDMPNPTIQVLTFSMGSQLASGGPVSLLRLPDDQLSDVIYLEQLAMASYLDATDEGHRYRHALDLLSLQATSTSQTQDLLTRILHQT